MSFMADVPHALKNVRNLMLEKGYKLPSVIIVERGKIVEVYIHGKVLSAGKAFDSIKGFFTNNN